MTKQQILNKTGLTEDQFYAQYPTEASFKKAMGGMVEEYKKGGWIQKATASIKRRGTEGVCTGSNFGGPSCRPGTKRYALAKTFRKMAKARKKEDGGTVDMYEDYMTGEYGEPEMQYAEGGRIPNEVLRSRLEAHMSPDEADNYLATYGHGGVVDVYQLMGMPTPSMYGMGGTTNIGDLSHVISMKNHSNMGMAMGGAINYPEGLQMPIFAMGGMTEQPTQINVELGELLTDKDGRIVTEYRGGGMVPHPEEGIDERGTVPAKEGMFVITKAMAKKYKAAMKNNDKLYADTIRNNIAFNKQKKEAAEEQAAMTAYDKFTAKYGGTIRRMYAQGGMINKYADGDVVNAITNPLSLNNTAFGNVDMSAFNNPMTRFSGAAGFSNTPSSLNLDYSPITMGQYRTGQTGSYMDYRNIPDTGIGYKGTDTPPSDPNKPNYQDFMSQAIPYGVAASQVIEPLLQRPFKMKSQDYETPADLKWRELTGEAGRRDLERARAGMQDRVRNIGGSNALSALTGGANEYYRNLAAYNEALENKNRMGQSEIDRANKAIQQGNLSQRMQVGMFNEQNRAARRNAIRQGVMNTAGTYYNQQANQMTKEGLSAAYPDYAFPWNKKKSS